MLQLVLGRFHDMTLRRAETPALVAGWHEPSDTRGDGAQRVGAKATGLLRLPTAWTPPFVVVPHATALALAAGGVDDPLGGLSPSDRRALVELLGFADQRHQGLPLDGPGVYVRSNAVTEDLSARGRYRSVAVAATPSGIAAGARDVLTETPPDMHLILQVAVNGIAGFLSNERRVSRSPTEGVVEGLPGDGGEPVLRVRVERDAVAGDGPLRASSRGKVPGVLAGVLAWHQRRATSRVLVEWVWDGARIWVVQCDDVPVPSTDPAAQRYLDRPGFGGTRARTVRPGHPDVAPFATVPATAWRKLARAHDFLRLGLPTVGIYVVRGCDLARPEVRAAVGDMVARSERPWVARTDVAPDARVRHDLLPTSAPIADPSRLLATMATLGAADPLADARPGDWAFLLAPLVTARASAMAYAMPGRTEVQVDALWGFPDGVMYLPHDTYLCDPVSGTTTAHIRHKPACLLYDRDRWRTSRLGEPYDWKRVLSDAEIRTVTSWAATVARDRGEPVRLMALAQVDGRRGPKGCVPFHYTVGGIPPPPPAPPSPRSAVTVETPDDLRRVARFTRGIAGVRLSPSDDHVRDSDFLIDVATFARTHDVPIVFDGSLLGHAYHVMNEAGATVVPSDPTPIHGVVRPYRKLVRDAIPAIIERNGSVARVRTLTPERAVPLLKRKLVEEALEAVFVADDGLVEELADVREVLDALQMRVPGGPQAVADAMVAKRESRGGFADLVFLESTAVLAVDAASARGARIASRRGQQPAPSSSIAVGDLLVDGDAVYRLTMSIPPVPEGREVVTRVIDVGHGRDIRLAVQWAPTAITLSVAVEPRGDPVQASLFDAIGER